MSLASLGRTNVNSVIASLLKMGNAQRQQFAQNHADDPLMLSAAKFVDNKIKEQAQAYLAQQSGAAPPKVNEQVIQAMGAQPSPQPPPQGQPAGQPPPQGQPAQAQPENSGIAQLPAPNMQGMAGGGIVAFAGEGESLVQDEELPRGVIKQGGKYYYRDTSGKMQEYTPEAQKSGLMDLLTPASAETRRNRALSVASSLGATQAPVGAVVPPTAPVGPSMNPGGRLPPVASNQTTLPPTGAGAGRGTGGAPAPAPAAGNRPPAMPAMKTTSDSDILATYKRIQEQQNPDVTTDPYAAQTEANRADAASVGQRQLSDATAREQGLAALLSKREGRIQEREGRIQGTEDLNTKMSIINAGLAMMQSTGKGLAGIAEGATVGAKQYGEGKKATELARQKIEDAKDAYDELRFNQEGMTAKEKTAAIATITSASISARNTAVKNMQDKQGLTAKQATDLFDNTIKAQLEKQRMENQLKLEAMQQGGANARAATQEAGANARTDKQIASQTTKFNPMTSYADYLKGFAGKETITPPMSYADYVAQFAPPKMVNIPDANLRP